MHRAQHDDLLLQHGLNVRQWWPAGRQQWRLAHADSKRHGGRAEFLHISNSIWLAAVCGKQLSWLTTRRVLHTCREGVCQGRLAVCCS